MTLECLRIIDERELVQKERKIKLMQLHERHGTFFIEDILWYSLSSPLFPACMGNITLSQYHNTLRSP